jgi:iron-sulfur cluster assembly protein
MLTLTNSAKEAVRQMVAAEAAPDGSGLRIAAAQVDGAAPSLSLDFAAMPQEGDTVVDEDGARIFLDETAASALDDKVLDATEHEDHVHLTVHAQRGDSSSDGAGPA